MSVARDGAGVASYVYHDIGRRISATSGGGTWVGLYLDNDIVYEADGTAVTKYLVAGAKYLAKVVTQAQAGAAGTLGAAAVVTPPVEPPDGSTSTSTSTKTPPGYIPPPDDQIIIIEPPIIYPRPPDEPPGEEPPPQEPPPSEPQPPSSYGVFYFHTDLVGSIRAVTDSQGQVVARYEYEPFGLTVKAEGPLAGHDVHKFTGKPEDAATGLYYFNARYYDPEAGRFISQDPLGDGPNLYVYCYQNPLRYVDPSGMAVEAGGGGGWTDEEWPEVLEEFLGQETESPPLDSWLVELERTLSSILSEAMSASHRSADDLQLALLMATGVVVHDSGKQHGSPERWNRIASLVAALKASGEAIEIWVNKSISTVTNGLVNCLKRPDVTARLVDGSYKAIEVASPSQKAAMLHGKLIMIVQECGPQGIHIKTVEVIQP